MAKFLGRSTDRKILTTALVIAGLLFFHWLGWLTPVENLIGRAFSPMMNLLYGGNSRLRIGYEQTTGKRDLAKENEQLNSENKKLLNENSQLQYLREENRILRKYVTLFDEAKYNYVLARVLARQTTARSTAENTRLIIDKGSQQGLAPGLLVIDQDGIAVAKIIAVKDFLAEAALLTSVDCRLSVALNEDQKTIGVAQGEAGLTVKIGYIPQTVKIKTGDLLVTSGLEPEVPHGFVVGRITEVNQSNNEIWQTAVVEPKSDLDNLRVVSVLLPPAAATK